LLILLKTVSLLHDWAMARETCRIKDLAPLHPAFPQSYPQKSGIVEKQKQNQGLGDLS
jgi:hypothetical protein